MGRRQTTRPAINAARAWRLPTLVFIVLGILAALAAFAALAVHYSIVFPRQPFAGPLPPLGKAERDLARRLEVHVRAIASKAHNIDHYAALSEAARTIERTLAGFGLSPQSQVYTVTGRAVRNIEVVIGPPPPAAVDAAYVVGAHYDSPDDSPGANDNGTGTAAVLELARLLATLKPRRTRLRLVLFVNEERPYGKTPDMGSWQHARLMKETGEPIAGMMSLETIGYFSDEPGSQTYPPPFNLVFPDKGNFIAFVGLPGSRAILRRALRSFRAHTAFPSIGGVAPGFLPGIDLSDHWSYDQFGFPAMMVTDTAPFRNPRYHTLDDLPETVDYESLARITLGLARVLRELAT